MSCPQGDYLPCGQGLPGNFCCESGQTCLALAGSTTALCCPRGSSCSVIQPITCDIQFQNVTAFPESEIFTTNLSQPLPACGKGTCCPFGFRCNGEETCIIETANTTNTTLSTPAASSSIPPSTLSSQSSYTTSLITSRISSNISSTTSLIETAKTTSTSSVQAVIASLSPTTSNIPVTSTPLSEHGLTASPKTIGIGVGVIIGVCLFVAIALLSYRRWIGGKRRRSIDSNSTPLLSTTWDPFPFSPRGKPSALSHRSLSWTQPASPWKRYSIIRKQTPPSPEELSRLPPWRPSNLQLSPKINSYTVPEVVGATELPATPLSFSFWNSSNRRTPSFRSTPHNPNYSRPKYGWPT
ncbi:hypothetical protein F5X96DRAFT_556265 [Biscogniauxia mediterranea]|nr:hypothetical protein F5X96DRAFT_556265 [Biscogniauxia mediterranea]